MSPEPTKYRFRDRVLEADRCLPLVDAIDEGEIKFGGLGRGGYPGENLQDDLPGLWSVGYWDASIESDWSLKKHRNEGIEIAFMESGSVPFWLRNRWHDMQAGDFTVTRPWQPHGLGHKTIPPSKLTWFIIDVGVRMPNQAWVWPDWIVLSQGDKEQLTSLLRQNESPIRHSDRSIAEAFVSLRKVLTDTDQTRQVSTVAVLINTILLGLINHLKTHGEPADHSLKSSRRAVEIFLAELKQHTDFLQREWTLDEMASECHVGRTAFSNLCKEICNQTPFEYLNHCRIEWAARLLLADSQRSITEIAHEVGFCSSAYFTKTFRGHLGSTPSAYRKLKL